MTSWIGTG
jgi:hypothetical protein